MNRRFVFDHKRLRAAGDSLAIAGADEAGRGCLAGPLVAAAVVFDYASWRTRDFKACEALDDSKKLTRERRGDLYLEIMQRARQLIVVSCAPGTIDRRGLHVCNLHALASAVEALSPLPTIALVDGFRLAACGAPHEAVVGGDGLSAAVAAASIVAKVTRDRLMRGLAGRYPQWGFDEHVGYATSQHHAAICEHGVCELHRMSFNSVAYQQLGRDAET
jgi:ribonuclease HII